VLEGGGEPPVLGQELLAGAAGLALEQDRLDGGEQRLLLASVEPAAEPSPGHDPLQHDGVAARVGHALEVELPGLGDAELVERGAEAGPQAEAGQVPPARLVEGRALAGLLDLEQRVEQGADHGDGPPLARGAERLLELATELLE